MCSIVQVFSVSYYLKIPSSELSERVKQMDTKANMYAMYTKGTVSKLNNIYRLLNLYCEFYYSAQVHMAKDT